MEICLSYTKFTVIDAYPKYQPDMCRIGNPILQTELSKIQADNQISFSTVSKVLV